MDSIEFQGISFRVTTLPLRPLSIQALSAVEDHLGFLFPEDYRQFVTTLGPGITNLSIQTLSPQRIVDIFLSEVRERLSDCWFWDNSPNVLTQAQAVECVPFFDSNLGDDILFHPSDPNRWFILGHEEEEVVVVHSFQELFDFYLKIYDDLRPPYEFDSNA
ncbi:SMI1/KNR4 family protein [Acaryochloris sp. IP29b_bin.137]|uniref:SMI1/KNR4 family protein n=1 Tax=Acaryochloris sp. IP29b_bin.137 TaxID=2969217 RepID=UPI0026234140|nr:SMI1/KNR4 family protein [Acaryochloris sp. IP29b_bin.137]